MALHFKSRALHHRLVNEVGTCVVEKDSWPANANASEVCTCGGKALSRRAASDGLGWRKQPRMSPPHCRRLMERPARHSAASAPQNNTLAAAAACLRTLDGDRAAPPPGELLAPTAPAVPHLVI